MDRHCWPEPTLWAADTAARRGESRWTEDRRGPSQLSCADTARGQTPQPGGARAGARRSAGRSRCRN